MRKILPISLKLNFTPNTLGCKGLIIAWRVSWKDMFSSYVIVWNIEEACFNYADLSYEPRLNWTCFCCRPESGCTGGDILSCLLCGGAGVLLCTTLVHLLPEVRESSEKYVSGLPAPLNEASAELLMCAGFFLMYFAEELVHFILHRRHRHEATAIGNNCMILQQTPHLVLLAFVSI